MDILCQKDWRYPGKQNMLASDLMYAIYKLLGWVNVGEIHKKYKNIFIYVFPFSNWQNEFSTKAFPDIYLLLILPHDLNVIWSPNDLKILHMIYYLS